MKYIALVNLACLIFLTSTSCNKKQHDAIKYSNRILYDVITIDEEQCDEQPLQGIDSAVGLIKCGKNKFNYDYGMHSDPGPTSLIEAFKPTFRTYHYSKFFMHLRMDEQAFRSLIPKAKIIDVKPKEFFAGELMFDCEPCNAVAQIEFINKVFNYPYTESSKVLATAAQYDFGRLIESGVSYKWYKNKETGVVGMYAERTKNTLKHKKLSIISTKGSTSKTTYSILRKIRLKDSIQE